MGPPAALMVGTGEYTTGFVGGAASGSDKKKGVVGLTLFDLRRRGKVGDLSMVGTSGSKFPAIRKHLHENITLPYNNLPTNFTSYPPDDTTDPLAYKSAIDALPPNSAITIFTPDSTHYTIALYAIRRHHHVLITKPAVKLLSEHLDLLREARAHKVLVYIEHHKRFDPAYADARHRALSKSPTGEPTMGEFNYFYAYMSQPKSQLQTFKSWAGKESDISYYLNSHHVDVCESMVGRDWRPVSVYASGSVGIAEGLGCVGGTEDTITLVVEWIKRDRKDKAVGGESDGAGEGSGQTIREAQVAEEGAIQVKDKGKKATAIFTASWTAPQNAGVHSQQRFHYVASKAELSVDQAKRGYEMASDEGGVGWSNPFYMKYVPDETGNFAGQSGYGYISFEKFIDAVREVNEGSASLEDIDRRGLPTLSNTVVTTAILEAGRRSLDEGRVVGVEVVGVEPQVK